MPLFCFSLSFSPFSPLYHDYNPSPPLTNCKREAGATSREDHGNNSQNPPQSKSHHSQEIWDLLPLSKACNPYYEHPGARQHEQQGNPLDVGSFMLEPVYILVSALHIIRT
jgi:hypothetical protein